MQQNLKLLKALSLLVFLAGCRQQVPTDSLFEQDKSVVALTDASLPFDADVFKFYEDDQRKLRVVYFDTRMPLDEFVSFYRAELEIFGWQEVTVFHEGSLATLIFEKPRRLCVITRRKGSVVLLISVKTRTKEALN